MNAQPSFKLYSFYESYAIMNIFEAHTKQNVRFFRLPPFSRITQKRIRKIYKTNLPFYWLKLCSIITQHTTITITKSP